MNVIVVKSKSAFLRFAEAPHGILIVPFKQEKLARQVLNKTFKNEKNSEFDKWFNNLNKKYKVELNQKTIERVKNSF